MIFKTIIAVGILICGFQIYGQLRKKQKRKLLTMQLRFKNVFGFEPPKPHFNLKNKIHRLIKDYIGAELEIEIDQDSELQSEIQEKLLLCRYFKVPVEKDIWDYSWDRIIKKIQSHQNIPINNPNSPNS
ncbi:MAG: hypothetical protein AAB772_00375 [Patescibacteria group bacterium]